MDTTPTRLYMTPRYDRIVEFRLDSGEVDKFRDRGRRPGERVLMRVSMIKLLYPDHCQIMTVTDLMHQVFEEDFPKVEAAFREMFYVTPVKAVEGIPGRLSSPE